MLFLSTEIDIIMTLATNNGTGMCVQQLALSCENNVYVMHNYTANDGSDYIGVTSMDLVFDAGSSNGTMRCIYVVINEDLIFETNETFTVKMTTLNSIVGLVNDMTTVTIIDTNSM